MKIFDYFFRPIPGSPFRFYIPLLILGIVILIGGGIMMRILRKKKEDRSFKKLFSAIPGQCFWIGILLLLNIGARYERFPLVGARFLLYIVLGSLIYCSLKHLYNYVKKLPKLREQFKETPAQKKYTTQKYN